ncbi:hypothetical protein SIN8267_00113 [Sinobacterium norvegicum]|uniref:Uncharacterized protein n=1 Tax=Sinobacterium norvegicum TaxID=1641715 RepID=A0ABM9A9Z5_9GAMM|nr:hypothetical protein [Sinobacterium norvegicum]CAH0990030.1 hypothetical protein SIN8267_00113 [Sinobacterium norvegicum]
MNQSALQSHRVNNNLLISPNEKPKFLELQKLSEQGNYWATNIVREIRQLAAGKTNHDSVYLDVNDHNNARDFVLKLPGCEVIATQELAGNYIVTSMNVDFSYVSSQTENTKPAVHWAQKRKDSWMASPKKDGSLKRQSKDEENWILAGVSDQYSDAEFSAKVTAEHIKASPFSDNGKIDTYGYNLFYSPGSGSFAGLKNLKTQLDAENSAEIRESAQLLAGVMEKAHKDYKRNQSKTSHKVAWVTQRGGSAVMTQALRILSDKSVNLEGSQKVFLSHPTSRTDRLYKLSRDVGMAKDTTNLSSHNALNGSQLLASLSNIKTTGMRARTERETGGYQWQHEGRDHLSSFNGGKAVGKAVGGVFTAVAASGGMAAVAGAIAGIACSNIPGVQEFPNMKSAFDHYVAKV